MYILIHISIYVCTYMYILIPIYLYLYTYTYILIHIKLCLYILIRIYPYTCKYKCILEVCECGFF